MAVFVEGLIGVIIFYIIILVIGLVAGRKKSSSADSQFLADRGLGLFVSSFTLSGKIVTEDDEHACLLCLDRIFKQLCCIIVQTSGFMQDHEAVLDCSQNF